ncbi:hypothetical protein AJ80_07840 [Polytolypa hystricis UAMH7299]|uniref:Aminoglycoside phosphotransferase domain-containing protein n=1 Tax=Polytolypa hystricis (strain UAMH7299) TaxID=1447883 RepID=A0A2B7XHX4_POLH7|nr:hypothetical protein AJ80_07840 [Polytolypa hystricis UAMH7299]
MFSAIEGHGDSIVSYQKAIALREMKTIKTLQNVPKQMPMIYGPEPLYQPSSAKKLAALEYYLRILEPLLLPDESALTQGYLWHDNLHHENIFVDPETLLIVGIIDCQSIQVAPLFDHCLDLCFLDYDGPDVGDNLGRPELPESVKSLEGKEKDRAIRQFLDKGVMVGWRSLFRNRMPTHYPSIQFQQSTRGNLLHLSRRIFELGEAHFHALLLDLQDEWNHVRTANSSTPCFPLKFSEPQISTIEADMRRADLGIEIMNTMVKRRLGDLWPEKGVIEVENYEKVKTVLREVKADLIDRYCCHQGWDTALFERLWPFDD